MTDQMTANKAAALAAYERARHGALGDASRILTTLQNAEFGDGDWGHPGSMEHWAHDLHEVSDDLHQEGEFADPEPGSHSETAEAIAFNRAERAELAADPADGTPETQRFIRDAAAQGYEVEPYAGRNFYKGPAVCVDGVRDFPTQAKTQHDNMGLGFIIYLAASDEDWYAAALVREDAGTR